MQMAVKLFARARDLAGSSETHVELPDGATVRELRLAVRSRHPALEPLAERLLIAVNADYAGDERVLRATDEIACFPPVSGG